jgi:chemotaxis protein CheC
MQDGLTKTQKQRLAAILSQGAEDASHALSKWLDQPVRLSISEVDQADMTEAADLLGPAEQLVAACAMRVTGLLTGSLILVFKDRSGLALADLLLRQPVGSATSWGELEQSAALETANIVGCAYLNSLAVHLPLGCDDGIDQEAHDGATPSTTALLPSPPLFLHEFAGSLLEFALMEQALEMDRLLLVQTRFAADRMELDWSLLLVPSAASLAVLASMLSQLEA